MRPPCLRRCSSSPPPKQQVRSSAAWWVWAGNYHRTLNHSQNQNHKYEAIIAQTFYFTSQHCKQQRHFFLNKTKQAINKQFLPPWSTMSSFGKMKNNIQQNIVFLFIWFSYSSCYAIKWLKESKSSHHLINRLKKTLLPVKYSLKMKWLHSIIISTE